MTSTIIASFVGFDFKEVNVPLIVVYDNPTDFEGYFVARLFSLDQPTPFCIVKKSLEDITKAIPNELKAISRHPKDDPKIVSIYM